MIETTENTAETIEQPNIDGLRIVGRIDPRMLTELPENTESSALLAMISGSDPTENFDASMTRTSYGKNSTDPFGAAKLNRIIGGHSSGKAHKDLGFKTIRVVSDSDGTIFYPSDSNGEPIFGQPYQAEPGVIVEFGSTVWHSAPYVATGNGTRTLLTARSS